MSAAQPIGAVVPELPDNIEAEQALLGAILLNNEAHQVASAIVEAEDFAEPLHQMIYRVTTDQIRSGRKATPVTIKPYLPANEQIGEMSVAQYLARLAAEAVTVINAPDYAEAVHEMAIRRRAGHACMEGIDLFADVRTDLAILDAVQHIRSKLSALIDAESARAAGEVDIATAFDQVIRQTADAMSGSAKVGVDTGFGPVNVLTGPWAGGQLVIIGGGAKQGKSALAMQCAMGAARQVPVWFYSGEMGHSELVRREIARVTSVSASRMRQRKISEKELEELVGSRRQVIRDRMLIQDKPMTLAQIDERIDRLTGRLGQVLVVIDYIALVANDRSSTRMSKFEFCEYVTHGLKQIAGKHDVPIVAVAQLKKNTFDVQYGGTFKRQLQAIEGRRPRYTDLYGGVERDADHTIIPWNLGPILSQVEPAEGTEDHLLWQEAVERHKNKARLILAISREAHFPASVDVGWDGPTTSFLDNREDTFGRTMF